MPVTGARYILEAVIARWNASTLDAEIRSRRANPADPHDTRYDSEAEPGTPAPYVVFSKSQGNRNSRQTYSDAESRAYRNIFLRFTCHADSPEVAADIIAMILDLYDGQAFCPSQGGIISVKYGGEAFGPLGDDEYFHTWDCEIVFEASTNV